MWQEDGWLLGAMAHRLPLEVPRNPTDSLGRRTFPERQLAREELVSVAKRRHRIGLTWFSIASSTTSSHCRYLDWVNEIGRSTHTGHIMTALAARTKSARSRSASSTLPSGQNSYSTPGAIPEHAGSDQAREVLSWRAAVERRGGQERTAVLYQQSRRGRPPRTLAGLSPDCANSASPSWLGSQPVAPRCRWCASATSCGSQNVDWKIGSKSRRKGTDHEERNRYLPQRFEAPDSFSTQRCAQP